MSKGNPPPGTDRAGLGSSALPADVLEALARNQVIEAIKRLRTATGLGLKEAKDVVEAHLRGQPLPPLPPSHEAVLTSVPPPVLAALHQGQKIEAIRLLREHTGLGLKEAKDVVDALPQTNGGASGQSGGLAPGEVPRGGLLRWVTVVVVLAVPLAWWWLRKT